MAVARVTKITAASPESWEHAANLGLERANKTLRNIAGFEVVTQKAKVIDGKITEYRTSLEITFILDD